MNERIVQFGERLSGITATPSDAASGSPAVILLNAGVVHRVGAHRLNVKIARRLAAEGIASLRFDLSGLGDSPPARAALGYEQQSIEDIGAALDCAKRELGASHAVAIGMCSGADNAYRAAVIDERLSGIVLLDPYAYESVAAKFDYMADRAANPDRWVRKLKKIVNSKNAPETEADPGRAMNVDRDPPPIDEFGADLQTITARGGKILIRYSSYVDDKITKAPQFFKTFSAFDFNDRLCVDVLSHVDHTYTELRAQAELLARIPSWFEENWRS